MSEDTASSNVIRVKEKFYKVNNREKRSDIATKQKAREIRRLLRMGCEMQGIGTYYNKLIGVKE